MPCEAVPGSLLDTNGLFVKMIPVLGDRIARGPFTSTFQHLCHSEDGTLYVLINLVDYLL